LGAGVRQEGREAVLLAPRETRSAFALGTPQVKRDARFGLVLAHHSPSAVPLSDIRGGSSRARPITGPIAISKYQRFKFIQLEKETGSPAMGLDCDT
jgi:hypothetical protein